MFGFGGKKKQRNVDPRSERPRTAYVDRKAPAEFHGKPVTGKVGDVWKGIYSLREDLEAEVEALCGGGVYVAKVNDEETHEYLGTHHFEIMGDPQQLHAAAIGHDDIGYDKIVGLLAQPRLGLVHRMSAGHIVSVARQEFSQRGHHCLLVIDDQDSTRLTREAILAL